MYDLNSGYQKSLEAKLRLVAEGEMIGLTPEEAVIYGIEAADIAEEDGYE